MKRTPVLAAIVLGAALASPAHAQQDRATQWLNNCREHSWSNRARYCDVRNFTVDTPAGAIRVDAGPNGGVSVIGWDKSSMLVVAKIQANGDDDADAKDIGGRIRIDVNASRVQADGPSAGRHQGWSVSYDLYVPRTSGLDVSTRNGGVAVDGIHAPLTLTTENGAIHLTNVGGDVHAETTNGGVSAMLDGTTWLGAGLDLRTTNGSVTLEIPRDYNARLETGTTNGAVNIGFPITVQGSFGRRITTTLGTGGPLIRATTVNGGVTIRSR